MSKDRELSVSFTTSPTIRRFLACSNQYAIIIGPVGSGKTVANVIKPYMWALEQEPGPDNVRYFKAGFVRNTMPELLRTTIQTYTSIFIQDMFGDIRRSSPVSHRISWESDGLKGGRFIQEPSESGLSMRWEPNDDNSPGLQYDIDFFALDRPQQVKSLLSYEATYLFFNEIREIPKAIIDAAGDRVGRYPSWKNGGVPPTKWGVAGDTNPPDEDHWIYDFCINPPDGWSFFLQPPGISEVEQCGENQFKAKAGEPDVGIVPKEFTTEWNGRRYAVNPRAENLNNLPIDGRIDSMRHILGRGNYYLSRVAGKDWTWIQSYYQRRFVYVREGRPVIPEFGLEQEFIVVDDLPVLEGFAIGGGFDCGGGTLSPAGIIGQKGPRGIYLIHAEMSVHDTGIERFGNAFKQLLLSDFAATRNVHGNEVPLQLEDFFGDPAGRQRDQIFEQVVFDHLKGHGIPVRAAPTNDPQSRIDATKAPIMRRIDGKPGILINRRKCPKLIKGLAGEWKFRKMQVPGSDRYADNPEKNPYSHVCEALGYYLCGKGELRTLRGRNKQAEVERIDDEYDYFHERNQ
jgi:hypothetical protein